MTNVLARLIAQLAKLEGKKELEQYAPASRGDILHDGLVEAGKTWGGILGTAAGIFGGEAAGGPLGGIAGATALEPPGALAGAWGAHGAYLGGQLIRDILTHPENWTVDAAGAIVPVTQDQASASNGNNLTSSEWSAPEHTAPDRAMPHPAPAGPISAPADTVSSDTASSSGSPGQGWVNGNRPSPSVFTSGAPPIVQPPPIPHYKLGGLPGMMIDAGYIDPTNPNPPPAGGLVGRIQDYLRNNPGASR